MVIYVDDGGIGFPDAMEFKNINPSSDLFNGLFLSVASTLQPL